MNKKFYVTKEVNERLDIKIVIYIQTMIATMDVEIDYLQVFDISGNILTHSQEVPEYEREYRLSKKYEDERLFCIRTDEDKKSYWTLMFSSEYWICYLRLSSHLHYINEIKQIRRNYEYTSDI